MTSEEIIDSFKRTFYPLQSTLGKSRIIVFYGPPCAGKTTVAEQLALKYNCHFVSMDELRTHYNPESLFSKSNNAEVLDVFFRELCFLAEKGQSVICEGMFYSGERRLRLKKYLQPFKTEFCYLTASIEILLKRLNDRNSAVETKNSALLNPLTPELLTYYFNKFSDSSHDVDPIDTSLAAVYDVIEMVSAAIDTNYLVDEI